MNAHQHGATDRSQHGSETSTGSFSFVVLVGAIAVASLVMALTILAAAQTVQI